MKAFLLLLLFLVGPFNSYWSQKSAYTALIVGIINEQVKGGCSQSRIITKKEVPVPANSYLQLYTDLEKELNTAYPPGSKGNFKYTFPTKYLSKPGEKAIIYSYTYQDPLNNCQVTKINVARGKTFELAQQQISNAEKNCSSCSNYIEMERWPAEL